jgi:hypothetical protein
MFKSVSHRAISSKNRSVQPLAVEFISAAGKGGMCVVLILVDSFLSYSQRDKMAVFFSLSKIIQFCFISLSGLGALVLGRSKPNRNKLMRRSSKLCKMAAH